MTNRTTWYFDIRHKPPYYRESLAAVSHQYHAFGEYLRTENPEPKTEFPLKAAVLHATGQPFQIEDVPIPEIGPDEVLIQTQTCGICRTDIHIQDGLAYVPSLPLIPGHEPAGVITQVGERVTGWSTGDRVVPHLFMTCGECCYCRGGKDAQCSDVEGIIGVTCGGGFAEYFKAPARNLLRLPDEVPFDIGGLVSCAVITAVHAYRRSRLSVNDTAVVLGAGGIGQILIQILKAAGARVVAWSRSRASLDIAQQVGADLALSLLDESAVEKIQEFSGTGGAAVVYECVGYANTMKLASQSVMRGGQIVVIGEEADFPEIDTIQIAQRELEIIGSRNGSRQDASDALAWMAAGVIAPPIYARFPLDEFNKGLQLVRDGSAHGRVIIEVR